ncbi:MAG: hypothetical protein VB089_05390 [Anaerolineaceae bacterium]|nr:hypothetical protein [Anaerolineaceae bacterium]
MKHKMISMILSTATLVVVAVYAGLNLPQLQAYFTTQETQTPSENQYLGLGILNLEGTDLAVTAEQAQELLPLWKAVKSLSTDDTTSQAEMEALYTQIEESLRGEQASAIASMTFDTDEISQMMGAYTAASQATGTQDTASSVAGASMQQPPQDMGDMGGPGDMMAGGGGDFGGGMDMFQVETQSQSQALSGDGSSSPDLNYLVSDSLIALLQERSAA